MKLLTYGLVLFCWLCSASIFAQNTYALIVGISQYKEMPALQYADRDAIAFAEFVINQGAPENNIKLFLNEEATRLNIVDELYKINQIAKPQDHFYFYFGGHGDLEANISNENTLLLLHDAPAKSYFKGDAFLQVSELKNWLSSLSKKQVQVVFIADACHSGGLIGGNEGQLRTQKVLQESWGNVTKILSSQANEFSLEGQQWGGGRGLFSYHLVNGLTGKADSNNNRMVSLEELSNYLSSNVTKEASPNVQTPIVLGEKKFLLAKVNPDALKKLLDAEQLSFPIISSANVKANLEDLLAQMDQSLVEIYKRFAQALKDKRINVFDDPKDYALMHFQTLVKANVQEHLLQIMKRNLGAGLMERELAIMQNVRERGIPSIARFEDKLKCAIQNLEETIQLFGTNHYISPLLQSRIQVLQSQYPMMPLAEESIDQSIQKYPLIEAKRKELLLQGLKLEPKMISTYILLGNIYAVARQLDSARYYQEKVLELMPNEGNVHLSVAHLYLTEPYKDSSNQIAPHPKAIAHMEEAVRLNPTHLGFLRSLSNLYYGLTIADFHDFKKAIIYYEKHLKLVDTAYLRMIKNPIGYPHEGAYYYFEGYPSAQMSRYIGQMADHAILLDLYKNTGDTIRAASHLKQFHQVTDSVGTVFAYMSAALFIYQTALNNEPHLFNSYMQRVLELQFKALKRSEADTLKVPESERIDAKIVYREVLKAIGVTYRNLKNYDAAKSYLSKALGYTVSTPPGEHFKYIGSLSSDSEDLGLHISIPCGIHKHYNGDYHYRLEANEEMFHLYMQQGKTEEAFIWLEKAFRQSALELGNDISGQPLESSFFTIYPSLDQTRFKTLKAKYFPPINTEKD